MPPFDGTNGSYLSTLTTTLSLNTQESKNYILSESGKDLSIGFIDHVTKSLGDSVLAVDATTKTITLGDSSYTVVIPGTTTTQNVTQQDLFVQDKNITVAQGAADIVGAGMLFGTADNSLLVGSGSNKVDIKLGSSTVTIPVTTTSSVVLTEGEQTLNGIIHFANDVTFATPPVFSGTQEIDVLSVSGASSLHDVDVTGDVVVSGSVSSDSLSVAHNVDIGGNLNVSGIITSDATNDTLFTDSHFNVNNIFTVDASDSKVKLYNDVGVVKITLDGESGNVSAHDLAVSSISATAISASSAILSGSLSAQSITSSSSLTSSSLATTSATIQSLTVGSSASIPALTVGTSASIPTLTVGASASIPSLTVSSSATIPTLNVSTTLDVSGESQLGNVSAADVSVDSLTASGIVSANSLNVITSVSSASLTSTSATISSLSSTSVSTSTLSVSSSASIPELIVSTSASIESVDASSIDVETLTVSTSLTTPAITVSGAASVQSVVSSGSVSASSATLLGGLSAVSATLSGALSASSATLSGALSASSLSAATLTTSGAATLDSATVSNTLLVQGDAQKTSGSQFFTITSDARVKEQIEDAIVEECMDVIKSIKIKHFHYSEEYRQHFGLEDKQMLGVIADELQQVDTECVKEAPMKIGEVEYKDFKQVDMSKQLFNLIGSVQYLLQEIETLKAKCTPCTCSQ